jgi:hypothetical protein
VNADGDSTRVVNVVTGAAVVGLLAVAVTLGAFRADDWINLERGRLALSAQWGTTWTELNPFSLYRPLVDLHHGVMLRLFGLRPGPHLAVLIALLLVHSLLLRRMVSLRGGPGPLAGAAVWAQANTWAWTVLWASNATGSLMATFSLLAMVAHHVAVDRAERGRGWGWAVAAACACMPLAALCKEEAVLLPAALLVMEATRWKWLGAHGRRAAVVSVLAIGLLAAGYAAFRLRVLPSQHGSGGYYGLSLGTHVVSNLAFFAMHLAPLPLLALVLSRVSFPGAWRREAWRGPEFSRARRGVVAGFAWAGLGILLYLPIGGHGYGYLYLPAFGIAFAVAHGLDWAARVPAPGRRAVPASAVLAVHAVVAIALTAWGLAASGWPRYRALEREAFAVMDAALGTPPARARVVFLDAAGSESLAGRTLFDLMFDDATGSMLRLRYGRDDLDATVLRGGEATRAIEHPPEATAVFLAREGRLTPVAVGGAGAPAPPGP